MSAKSELGQSSRRMFRPFHLVTRIDVKPAEPIDDARRCGQLRRTHRTQLLKLSQGEYLVGRRRSRWTRAWRARWSISATSRAANRCWARFRSWSLA
mgnify:CR=1 FL=1